MGYDVFISYSHGGDDLLSERVQDALGKFAKPWYRRRALKVFRDRTALSANPGLWTSIAEAVDESRYFLFLASPEAARSVWCGREVAQWRATHGSEGLLVLQTDGELRWDDTANDFDWAATTAVGAAFAGCFAEEPRHIDMRWARSEVQLDLSDGRFRDQIAEIAAPVRGVPKDELAGEDVRQHRRAIRQAIAAAIALAALTFASIAMSIFAVRSARSARRSAAEAHAAQLVADHRLVLERRAQRLAEERRQAANRAKLLAIRQKHAAQSAKKLAEQRAVSLAQANSNLNTANTNLTVRGLALRKSTLLAEARLAARRSEQLMGSGDQTYQLGVLLAGEAVRHACASSAIVPESASADTETYPNGGCAAAGTQIDGSVAGSALAALANAGGRFVTGRLAGADTYVQGGQTVPYPVAWSADGKRLATFSTVQSSPPDVVQVWNADGSVAASATSASGMTSETALSADGSVVALTSTTGAGVDAVSTWSLPDHTDAPGVAGHRPSLSANGAVVAWLAPHGAKAIEITVGHSAPRAVALPDAPVEVAVNAKGSLAVALVATGSDTYALIPVDVRSGRVGRDFALGSFAIRSSSGWSNPPRVRTGVTADPPALWFDQNRARVWVYNNETHVGVDLRATSAGPTSTLADRWTVPTSIAGGDLSSLQSSTPNGRVAVLLNLNAQVPTYEVWTQPGSGWTTTGIAPLELCISQASCSLSISPNGRKLAVSSLSALQIIDLAADAGSASGIVSGPGVAPEGTSVVSAPSGSSALSWNARTVVLVDSARMSVRVLPIALSPGEQFATVGFSSRGDRYVVVVGHNGTCPCRVVVLDAATGGVVAAAPLGATQLDAIPGERPVGASLDDGGGVVAVTFDAHPADTKGVHHSALATFSTAGGQPLLVRTDESLAIGDTSVSAPAFQPGSEQVGLVATSSGSHQVGGVLMDARTGAVSRTVGMQKGVVTLVDGDSGNDGAALRFSPNGEKLAWNAGGSVVVWDIGPASGPRVTSNVVLTSLALFDRTALAISDNGQVATVGFNYYSDPRSAGSEVVLTGDELGRFLQPVGVARIAPATSSQTAAVMSVAMPAEGQIAAVALDADGSRYFTNTWGGAPSAVLAELCASSSRTITADEWQTYFPGEAYGAACPGVAPSSVAFDATPAPPPAQASSPPSGASRPVVQAYRKRLIGIVSNSSAVVTRPTHSQTSSSPHSKMRSAAKASVT